MEDITSFKILSHACLLVKRGNVILIIDPWLVGSCYWRSWWNYPEPDIDENELSQVSHVLISHIHWDHWHGATLKKYFKNCQFLIPDEPKTRSYDDLVNLRLGQVNLIKHNQTIHLGNEIKVTIYQFGLFQNDSAIVIETPEVKILNANDAKIAGGPLRQVLNKHGAFDFALRSHSTANFRACISIENDTNQSIDDNEHYARSFQLFMNATKPKYAVPFASNNCHLHQDTYHFNHLITNPIKLNNWILEHGGLDFSELKIMLPGSSWCSQKGFLLSETTPFENLEDKLAEYQQRKSDILEKYYKYESSQILNAHFLSKHEQHLKDIPWLFKVMLKRAAISYKIVKNDGDLYFSVDYKNNKLIPITEPIYQSSAIKCEWPVLVFKQSVGLKMYAHAFISKRVKFFVKKDAYLNKLVKFLGYLEKIEHELFPIKFNYIYRLFISYCRRWRELIVYSRILKDRVIHKKTFFAIEEKVLRNMSNSSNDPV